MPIRHLLLAVGLAVAAGPVAAKDVLVRDQAAYAAAAKAVRPGDTIVLADGEWRDFAIRLVAEGTAEQPVTLRAEHPGKVVLTGRSGLAVAGRHLVVANLVFRDGYAPKDEVVATRVGKRWAEHLRLTGIVIDGYNNPDRRFEDHWVALYGRDIRLDHSHIAGKANAGATLVVVREGQVPFDNRVRIDHNYFGPRPVLGANGGETIRIGTSAESMSDSSSIVEDNRFERCDGEVEIVSIKSSGNIVRGNVFVESQGSVVLRHGNGNRVERNVFLGHGVPRTGGIRVINERQVVRDNYMEGLRGTDFAGAMVVMNGVPNSPINRYLPVRDAVIQNNSLVDIARVVLGAGASEERSQPPAGVRVVANLVTGEGGRNPLSAEASLAGFTWTGNVASPGTRVPGIVIEARPVALARAANGLLYPTDPTLAAVGAPRDLRPVRDEDTGPAWYPKPRLGAATVFRTGRVTDVATATALAEAVERAAAGDTIRLARGRYAVNRPLIVARPLTVTGRDATLAFTGRTLFQLAEGGSLRIAGLAIAGGTVPGQAVIHGPAGTTLANHLIAVEDCSIADVTGDVIAATPATLMVAVILRRSAVARVTGAVIAGRSETGRDGLYAADDVLIDRVTFSRVGTIADLHRGGTDESTFGPRLVMTGSAVTDSGPLILSGVQETTVTGNRFARSRGILIDHSVGSPRTIITGNRFAATPPPLIHELTYKGPPRAIVVDNEVTG